MISFRLYHRCGKGSIEFDSYGPILLALRGEDSPWFASVLNRNEQGYVMSERKLLPHELNDDTLWAIKKGIVE